MNISDPLISVINVLFIASLLHGIFLSAIIYRSNPRDNISRLVSLVALILSVWILNYMLYTTGWIYLWPHLMNVCIPILYLAGPIFLFIAKSLKTERYNFSLWDAGHLIPFIVILLLNIPEYFQSAEEKLQSIGYVMSSREFNIIEYLWGIKLNLFTASYGLLSLKILQAKSIQHSFYNPYRRILSLVVILFVIKIFLLPILHTNGINAASVELLMVLLIASTIHVMGYYFFKSLSGERIETISHLTNRGTGKYNTSPLQKSEIKNYVTRIEELFQSQKPWKDPKYSINDLSHELAIPKHHLSQVINEGLNLNFHELINNYRVHEVINRLTSGDHEGYSISGIGADCGFNSSSTFHRAFKKVTGVTPSKFIQSIEITKEENPSIQ